MISNELLSVLCCPETKKPLEVAGGDLVDQINQKIASGELKTRNGSKVTQEIDSGLICRDGKYLYAIRQDIPIMLIEESIPLEGLK